jgi:hypothetical protein
MSFTIPNDQPIIGSPSFGYLHCDYALRIYAPYLTAPDRAAIASACVTYGTLANIGDLFILAHMAKECAWFRAERWTKSFNPGGLGATNDGAWGSTFRNASEGIAAMVGHQIVYAVAADQMTPPQKALASLDPRASAVFRTFGGFGVAPRWIDLSQKWGVIKDPAQVPAPTAPNAYGMSIIIRVRGLANLVLSSYGVDAS